MARSSVLRSLHPHRCDPTSRHFTNLIPVLVFVAMVPLVVAARTPAAALGLHRCSRIGACHERTSCRCFGATTGILLVSHFLVSATRIAPLQRCDGAHSCYLRPICHFQCLSSCVRY
ncbi:hypothetical protein EDD18DRAFT_292072 [Armillaria luteobubalina]|uniref:Uncharacterized protein n=1 Tax=Armillaria luteobubalina TaxID=153913 RepID=A0AA39TMP1_9AGAR|nr:hypothetical protein EDD18DRAFT_292072 [Armillaria luteobubalina]